MGTFSTRGLPRGGGKPGWASPRVNSLLCTEKYCIQKTRKALHWILFLNNLITSTFFKDFIYLFMRDKHRERKREREREREAETQAEGEAGSMQWEPDAGFDPGSPGSGQRQAPNRCATQGSPL